jgi:GH15 family glucan-1,4-alpha-glucosidase
VNDPRRTDGFTPLRSYLATGDGRTVALIAADGSTDWLAIPSLDDAPTFAALLDPEHGGVLTLCPSDPFTVRRRYRGPTNVIETEYTTATGIARVTESLNSGVAGRLPWTEFARRVEGVTGSVAMGWQVGAGRALGGAKPWARADDRGILLGAGPAFLGLVLDGVGDPTVTGTVASGAFHTSAGSRGLLALAGGADELLHVPTAHDVQTRLDLSIQAWQTWSDQFSWDGPWPAEVLRSALSLKLLLYSPTGAIAAAATTSLPEQAGGGKNWDYRYSWVRDTAYTIDAFVRCGLHEEIHAALTWLLSTVTHCGGGLQPFYTLHGEPADGRTVSDVPGYLGSRPVVEGNDAVDQLQLGSYGDLLQAVLLTVRQSHVLDDGTQQLLLRLAGQCRDHWQEPDSGMWELPGARRYTASAMSCWQAMDRTAALSECGQLPGPAQPWRREAERIRAWIAENCWSDRLGSYLMHPGADDLDAGVLLGAASGFDRGERMSSTIDALRRELGAGPALYRCTGMQSEEGAFIACTFWAVEAQARCGRMTEARALMEQMLTLLRGAPLLAEMIDPSSGDFLGNVPQALSHLALINAAAAVAEG